MRLCINTCQWLTLSSTKLCGLRCMGEYCHVHLSRLRKDVGTKSCIKCGKGVINYLPLWLGCGYSDEKGKDRYQKNKSSRMSFYNRPFRRMSYYKYFPTRKIP